MPPYPQPTNAPHPAPRIGVSIGVLVAFFGLLVALSYPTIVLAAISGALAVSTYNRVRTRIDDRYHDHRNHNSTRARLVEPRGDR
ncbi:hypothetical protein ACLI4Y_04865 [Natrialbaceae archaeon A-CW3]